MALKDRQIFKTQPIKTYYINISGELLPNIWSCSEQYTCTGSHNLGQMAVFIDFIIEKSHELVLGYAPCTACKYFISSLSFLH